MTRPRTISIAETDRARVPFAVVGVLLLVSSVTIAVALETRHEPEIDTGTEDAVDRGEAYATSAVRDAAVRATDDVVESPVTTVDDELRPVLGDDDEAFENQVRLTIFAAVSESLEDRDQRVGQGRTVELSAPDVDDWSDPDALQEGLEHVHLEEDDGVLEVTVEEIEITVREGGDVETTTTRDVTVAVGSPVLELHERVEAYEEHLNTGMLEAVDDREGYGYDLAKRLWPLAWGKAYYDRLLGDADDRAFENVTPNDHTEVMANDARLSAQEQVFGTRDDYGHRTMAGPFLCMAFDLAEAGIDVLERDRADELADDLHPDENVSNVDDLCADGVVSPDGELPEMPTVEDVVSSLLENIDKSGTIQGHPFADMAMYEMEAGLDQEILEGEMRDGLNETDRFTEEYLEDYYDDGGNERTDTADLESDIEELSDLLDNLDKLKDDSVDTDNTDRTIENVYTLNGVQGNVISNPSRDGPTHPPTPNLDPGEYDVDNLTEIETQHWTTRTGLDASIDKVDDDGGDSSLSRSLVEVDIEVEMQYGTTTTWNDTTTNSSADVWKTDRRYTNYTAAFELDGEFAPGLETDPRSVDHALDRGGSPDPYADRPTNWEAAPDEITAAYFGRDFDSDSEFERWLRPRLSDVESTSDFEDAIEYDSRFDEEIQLSPRSETALHSHLVWDDLMEVHNETVTEIEPVEADVLEMLSAEESPIREIIESVETKEAEFVDETEEAENAPDMAKMEARKAYFENIYEYVDDLASQHERVTTGGENLIDSLLGEFLDSANEVIGGPMELLEDMLGSADEAFQDDERSEIDTPEVLNDVHVNVDGSPTYHSSQVAVSQDEVPAVRASGDGPLDVDEDARFAPMGAGYENEVGFPGFPMIPWPPLFYLQVDVWEIEVEGEYARFEVEANSGDPSRTDSTKYVRENKDVTLETPDEVDLELGSTDPISYENAQNVLIVVPAPQFLSQGAPGVGDDQHGGNAPGGLCSPLWGHIGPGLEGNGYNAQEKCV